MLLRHVPLAVIALLVSAPLTWAQPELFVPLSPSVAIAALDARPSSSGAVVQSVAVGMQIDHLFGSQSQPTPRVRLNISGREWTAAFQRIETDAHGFRSWVGAIEGVEHSHVVFTERDGIVAGLMNGVSTTYQVRTVEPGVYALEEIDAGRLGREHEPMIGTARVAAADHAELVAERDDASAIDVLILYTPSARNRAGGTAQIQAVASQIISSSNTIFSRSGVVARFRLAGTSELALSEAVDMSVDLHNLTDSHTARTLRDSTRADLVHLLMNSPDELSCGIGWLLTAPTTNFDAFSVSDIACVSQYTPTHEMGHSMGAHHAPEDGAGVALYPYSYGFKDRTRGWRTIMANNCAGTQCPRIANFSNPAVQQNGIATGSSTQNNALSLNNIASAVANWRISGSSAPPVGQPSPPPLPPSAPTGLRAEVSNSNVAVAWNGVAGANSYTLHVGSAPGASNLFNASVGGTTGASGAVWPGTYFWRVFATNAFGASPASTESQFTVGSICATPGAPSNFNHGISGRNVTLAWSAPSSGVAPAGYLVEAGSASGLANLYNGPTGSAATSVVVPAPPGLYFVRIRAYNACGASGVSNEQMISVP